MTIDRAEQKGVEAMYDRRNRANFGPATYTNQEFLRKICVAAELRSLHKPVSVLDLMSGPGLLGSGLQKLAPQHRYYYLDLIGQQLAKITNAEEKIAGDARQMPFKENVFRVGVVRYGAKDIPQDQQAELFREMYRVTSPKGCFVLADMYAPVGENKMENGQVYEWLNYQHAMKQERSGRNRVAEGSCHIPTETGWLDLFTQAGFRTHAVKHHISFVTTTDWLKSNQITEDQLKQLNQIILTAPHAAKRAFNIREEGDSVKIDYPVTIIRAIKL